MARGGESGSGAGAADKDERCEAAGCELADHVDHSFELGWLVLRSTLYAAAGKARDKAPEGNGNPCPGLGKDRTPGRLERARRIRITSVLLVHGAFIGAGQGGRASDRSPSLPKGARNMRRPYAVLPLLVASLIFAGTAVAATPKVSSTVSISVPNGSLHYNTKRVTAKAGLVQINFTNDSKAPHNVSLEHNGELEYGASLTIRQGAIVTFLTLAKGTYHLYSSVGKDEDKGMSATLIVR
jgi:plastocyanin